MDRPRVLVANEPHAYRVALARALRELRPDVLVHPVDPAELDLLVAAVHPALVVCSRLSPAVQAHAGTWFLLPPPDQDGAAIDTGCQDRSFLSIKLPTVVAAIDAALDRIAPERPTVDPNVPLEGDPTEG